MHIYSFNNLKFTLKHLKRSYMFRSHDRPQGAYIVPCLLAWESHTIWHTTHTHSQAHSKQYTTHTQYTRHAATAPTQPNEVNHWVFLNYNFSKEQSMFPEDDRVIEIL